MRVIIRLKATLLSVSLLVTGCVAYDNSDDKTSAAALRKCRALADCISAQYVTTAHALPVQYDSPIGFVDIKVPSLYEVTFQHKGHQAVIDACLIRQRGK